MNPLAMAAMVVVSIWLGLQTITMLMLIRQVSVLTLKVAQVPGGESLLNDGPEVGSVLPADLVINTPRIMHDKGHLLLISATCASCRELAGELSGSSVNENIVALIPGSLDLARGLAELLPSEINVVFDPLASDVASQLHITSAPFALTVEDGTVIEGGTFTTRGYSSHTF